jgi:hypothetical protein
MKFAIRENCAGRILWHVRSHCSEPGCRDPLCVCSLCGEPIGTPDDDPRWDQHNEDYCGDCDLCRDQVPLMLFQGEGRAMKRAQFHRRCFETIVEFKAEAAPAGGE